MPLIRKIATTAVVIPLTFLFSAIMFAALYDLYEFRPFAGKIEATYQAMDREDRAPPANVQSSIWEVDGSVIDGFAARKLLYEALSWFSLKWRSDVLR